MGFLLNQNGLVLGKGNERTSRSVEVSERCGKKRREASRPASTKRLPQCVCSILSISKAGPPAHSCVVVCSYLAQPYPTVGVLVHNCTWCLNNRNTPRGLF